MNGTPSVMLYIQIFISKGSFSVSVWDVCCGTWQTVKQRSVNHPKRFYLTCISSLRSLKPLLPISLSLNMDGTVHKEKKYASKFHPAFCKTFPFLAFISCLTCSSCFFTLLIAVLFHFILPCLRFEGLPCNDCSSTHTLCQNVCT